MILSPIQLEFYYVESLRWKIEQEYEPAGEAQLSLDDLECNVQRTDETNDGRKTAYRLTLCLAPAGTRYPYSFEIVVVGSFLLDASVPDDRIAPVLDANAPAMLYSMAREVLATALGRGPFRALLLPSVNFTDLKRESQTDALNDAPVEATKTAAPGPRKRRRASKATADT